MNWQSSIVFGLSVCLSVPLSIRCCGHSNLVIFILISSKFYIWIASIKLCFKLEYGFFPMNDYQHGRQNGPCLSVCIHPLLWSLLVNFNWISSKLQIWFAYIKPWFKFEYEICPTKDKQDGRHNGHIYFSRDKHVPVKFWYTYFMRKINLTK